MSEKFKKRILKSPELNEILEITGGFRKAMSFIDFEKLLKEQDLELKYETEEFDRKENYANEIIVQAGVIILDAKKIVVTSRSSNERRGKSYVNRITNNASIITSSSETDQYDWQGIIDQKIKHDNIKVEKGEPDIIAVNNIKNGYIFLVKIVRTDTKKVLGGLGTDKEVKAYDIMQTFYTLREIKEMENNILKLALEKVEK